MRSNSGGGHDDPMGPGSSDGRSPEGAAKRGLWRLMLKLPAVRATMQALEGKSAALTGLFEAYEDTCATLDRLLRNPDTSDPAMIAEYRTICSEIEADVLRYCLERTPPSQDRT